VEDTNGTLLKCSCTNMDLDVCFLFAGRRSARWYLYDLSIDCRIDSYYRDITRLKNALLED
jgi:hypothetical protein